MNRTFQARKGGGVDASLSRAETDLIVEIARQLRTALEADVPDESMRRLFPPAYEDDLSAQDEFERFTSDDLRRERLRAIDGVIDVFERARGRRQSLDEEQASQLLGVLNNARLTMGTRLDVTENLEESYARADERHAAALHVYEYLGWLEEQLIAALAASSI